jgi:hypothetical protein
MVAFLPWALAGGQALVWCVSADGHSTIEQAHSVGTSIVVSSDAEHETTADHLRTNCDDFGISRIASLRHPPTGDLVVPVLDTRAWFIGTIVAGLQLPVVSGNVVAITGTRFAEAIQHTLAQLMTVILRV